MICELDEETKADYKQFKQLLSINKHIRSDKPEITAINCTLQKNITRYSCRMIIGET